MNSIESSAPSKRNPDLKTCQENLRKCREKLKELNKKIEQFEAEIKHHSRKKP